MTNVNKGEYMSKTYTKWLNRVNDVLTPWTENEIIYFRKYLGESSSITDDQRHILLDLFNTNSEYNITPEQTNKGIAWLTNTIWTSKGKARSTELARVFGYREKSIVNNFYEFKFVGLQNVSQNSYRFYMPVYRVVAKDGSSFEYVAGSMGTVNIVA